MLRGFVADARSQLTLTLQKALNQPREGRRTRLADTAARAKGFLDTRYAERWTLQKLARAVACNRTELAKAFKAQYGISIHRYLIARRIEVAKPLLVRTDEKVESIAADIGYSKASLERNFLRLIGVGPLEYRQSERGRLAADSSRAASKHGG